MCISTVSCVMTCCKPKSKQCSRMHTLDVLKDRMIAEELLFVTSIYLQLIILGLSMYGMRRCHPGMASSVLSAPLHQHDLCLLHDDNAMLDDGGQEYEH